MKIMIKACALLVGSLVIAAVWLGRQPAAEADPPPDPVDYAFVTIDEVARVFNSNLLLVGLEEGAAEPVSAFITLFEEAASDACERYALMMLDKPGRYRLFVRASGSNAFCWLQAVAP